MKVYFYYIYNQLSIYWTLLCLELWLTSPLLVPQRITAVHQCRIGLFGTSPFWNWLVVDNQEINENSSWTADIHEQMEHTLCSHRLVFRLLLIVLYYYLTHCLIYSVVWFSFLNHKLEGNGWILMLSVTLLKRIQGNKHIGITLVQAQIAPGEITLW